MFFHTTYIWNEYTLISSNEWQNDITLVYILYYKSLPDNRNSIMLLYQGIFNIIPGLLDVGVWDVDPIVDVVVVGVYNWNFIFPVIWLIISHINIVYIV